MGREKQRGRERERDGAGIIVAVDVRPATLPESRWFGVRCDSSQNLIGLKQMENATSQGNTTSILIKSRSVIENDVISNSVVQLVFSLLYGNIFAFGVFGNCLVCLTVVRNPQMRTVTNLFIGNLALSDVLLCVLAVPFTPLYTFLGEWRFGCALCHLVPYAQGVSVYISTLTLTSIAIDRFLLIVYPFRPRMRIQVCLAVILGIWIVALLLTLPYGIYMQLEEPYTYCEEHWPGEQFRMIFSSLTSILQFVLPFIVTIFCYVSVSARLSRRTRLKPGVKSNRREEIDKERKRRTNRLLIAMVVAFGISWLPLNLINILDDFYSLANEWSYYRLCFFMTHCLAMSSTCHNPFLYAWLNENLRKEFKQVLPCNLRPIGAHTLKTTDGLPQYQKEDNGNDTVQESMLLNQVQKEGNPEVYELIPLDPATANVP